MQYAAYKLFVVQHRLHISQTQDLFAKIDLALEDTPPQEFCVLSIPRKMLYTVSLAIQSLDRSLCACTETDLHGESDTRVLFHSYAVLELQTS